MQATTTETALAAALLEQAIGFHSVLLRGQEKVGLEWTLVATSYNLKRLFKLGTPLRSA
ncbi:MAG: Transposase domain [Verrucomicrobiota bacterium]